MITALIVAGVIILTAAALDHAYNGFDDDDDDDEILNANEEGKDSPQNEQKGEKHK